MRALVWRLLLGWKPERSEAHSFGRGAQSVGENPRENERSLENGKPFEEEDCRVGDETGTPQLVSMDT